MGVSGVALDEVECFESLASVCAGQDDQPDAVEFQPGEQGHHVVGCVCTVHCDGAGPATRPAASIQECVTVGAALCAREGTALERASCP